MVSRISSVPPTWWLRRAIPWTAPLLMGFDVLCNGWRAFINCTRDLLLKDGISLLPSSQTVVEVLERVLNRTTCDRSLRGSEHRGLFDRA